MDVEHFAVPALHELRGKQSHETAEANQFDLVIAERGLQRFLECGAIPAEWLAFDDDRRDAACPGLLETSRLRAVGNHERYFGRIILLARRLDQRGHVRSAARDQDGDPAFHPLTAPDRGDRYRRRDVRPWPGSLRRAARHSRRLR